MTYEFKILIEVCNLKTQDTISIVLPNSDLKRILSNFGDGILHNNIITNYSSKIEFTDAASLSPVVLNNLLLEIESLPESRQRKVYDLYMNAPNKNYIELLIAYKNEYHYEVVSPETAHTDNYTELKRRAGEIYMLGICQDILLLGDANDIISDKYRDAMFREGIRAGEIIFIEGKYYIKDSHLMECLRDEDFDYYTQEEEYTLKGWLR